MRECTVNEGRANRTRATASVLAIAVLLALGTAGTGPAAAADFEIGEVQAHVDTTVSVGASMRVQDRDCHLIHVTNGGCAEPQVFLNSDDGNLNYDKWDVFANTYKATVDVDLAWKNFGGFFRGTVFYDPVAMHVDTDRTDLDRDALYRSSPLNSGVVGMGYQLLDAYVYGNFDVAGRPLEIRIGNQVLSWGESLFYQGGVSAINTVDLNRLRAPGSNLKEAFLPSPMVRVSAEIFRNFSIEAFYQLAWNYTQLDPVGSYFSGNDLVGRAAEGLMVLYDPGIEDKYFEQVARELAIEPDPVVQPVDISLLELAELFVDPTAFDPADFAELLDFANLPRVEAPHLLGARPGDLPRTAEEMFEAGHTPIAPYFIPLPQLLDPPFGGFVGDDWARSQGQWGVALRYFAEAIRTEFGAYYLRIHDKVPSVGYVAEPVDIAVGFEPNDLDDLLDTFDVDFSDFPPLIQTVSIPTGYFREYPEDINVFGLSAATELFGIAWGAEVSYQTSRPVPRNGELVLRELLLDVIETGQRMERSGFSRERRLQAQLNAIATLGPGDPYVGALVRALRISSIAVTFEVAAVKFPSLDSDNFYQPTNSGGEVDELSWGYQTLIQGFYDNPFGVPITVTPRFSWAHDVHGNTPGFFPFIEHRKSFAAGVNVDYLGVWQFDLAYTSFFGAEDANMANDRDYVSLSVTRSF
jgi:hypothetical protein